MRLIFFSFLIAAGAWAQIKAPTDAASLQAGMKSYQFHCAFCHGKGDDGFAANLVSPNLVHAPTDSSLLNIIRNGIIGTDMPPALGMSEQEMLQVAGYVRTLGRSAPTTIAGNAGKGKALYMGKGACASCHMLEGAGGRMGPDLTQIGAMRSPSNLRSSIMRPSSAMVGGWTMVHVSLKSGAKVNGIRMNEDNFYISLRDGKGKIHTLAKSDATSIDRDLTKSSMPSYEKVFTAEELDDLIAYLFSLRGAM